MEPEDNILNTSTEELEKAREILGNTVKNLSDQELQKVITQFDHLLDMWMETYERSIFDGKTLDELVNTN
jgi:hypothetical protein